MAEADPVVEEFVGTKLIGLGLDAETYANYVASFIADAGVSAEEKLDTLTEMLQLTITDERDMTSDIRAVIEEAIQLQSEQDALNQSAANDAPEEAPEPVISASSGKKDSDELDDAIKKAIVMQYGFETESESESEASRPKYEPRKKKAPKEDVDKVRSSKLNAALSEIEATAGPGVDMTGMGRRAKRALLAKVSADPRSSDVTFDSEITTKTSNISDTTAASAGRKAVSRADDIADVLGSALSFAEVPSSSKVVEFDPLSIRPNNRQVAKEIERAKRDEQRSKHDAEERALRDAAEAARAARERARQYKAAGKTADSRK